MRPIIKINADDKLSGVLSEFKKGKTHIAIVRKVIYEETLDHSYENVGVLTLEDIIEALIQDDIQDEHDIERKRKDKHAKKAALLFAKEEARFALSAQEILAIHVFLYETVPVFSNHYITSESLYSLINESKVLNLMGNEDSNLNITFEDEPLTLETIRKESVSYDTAVDHEWT
jgi:metal transporter CNNM